jgi:t-SNARE complex subunit (syntaxin)
LKKHSDDTAEQLRKQQQVARETIEREEAARIRAEQYKTNQAIAAENQRLAALETARKDREEKIFAATIIVIIVFVVCGICAWLVSKFKS